jgi:hypothetical protein
MKRRKALIANNVLLKLDIQIEKNKRPEEGAYDGRNQPFIC